MQHSIAVFDTDDMRASSTRAALEEGSCIPDLHVCMASSAKALKRMVSQHEVGVIIADMRSRAGDHDAVDVVCESQASASGVQVIYAGVDESTLLRASMAEHACLLPTTYGVESIRAAATLAFERLDRWLEQPLMLHTRQFDRTMAPGKIGYVESDRRKLRIHAGDEVVEVYGKLSGIGALLPGRFVQCHKSFMVNLGYVEQMLGDCVVLTTGERIPVSQKRRRQTRDAFVAYVGRSV